MMTDPQSWMIKAVHDLTNAEHTLTLPDSSCPFDTVCFHAQQCAEKCLKAVFVKAGMDVPRTHDLVVLNNTAVTAGLDGISADAVLILNRYSVEARYPGDWEPFDRDTAAEAVALAKSVKTTVEVFLKSGI